MTRPGFFIVGAAKSGTTSLYYYLDQHPSIYMSPIKEPCFFAPEVAEYTDASRAFVKEDAPALRAYLDGPMTEKRGSGIVLDWHDYLKLFKHARDERAIGEASVSYLTSAVAANRMLALVPEARIIMLLRDPASRLFSQYAETVASGHTRSTFMEWVDRNVEAEKERKPPFGPVWTSHYAPQLSRYVSCFGDRVRVYLHDEFARQPDIVLRRTFEFLDVDPAQAINLSARRNVTRVPRLPAVHRGVLGPLGRAAKRVLGKRHANRLSAWWFRGRIPPVAREERRRLIRMFEPDIDAVETFLGHSLPAWRDPSC